MQQPVIDFDVNATLRRGLDERSAPTISVRRVANRGFRFSDGLDMIRRKG